MALSCSPLPLMQDLPSISHTEHGKRKFDDVPEAEGQKRVRIGPFVMDDDEDDDDPTDTAFRSENYPTQTNDNGLQLPQNSQTNVQRSDVDFEAIDDPSQRGDYNTVTSNSYAFQNTSIPIRNCSGKTKHVRRRAKRDKLSFERIIAERSATAPGKATRSYYGIDIHTLIDEAKIVTPSIPKIQPSVEARATGKAANSLWTEKYRARKFRDLIGDDRTHRAVLHWLKGWDPIVFPGIGTKTKRRNSKETEERPHRKILLLTGPPGLGKTTLAHVCARQVGYEVLEINASDERSRNVVKGRIKDAVGTENVKGVNIKEDGKTVRRPGKPVCVVIDEVDGVVSGSGGSGEGGFIKALVDLIQLDQKNSAKAETGALGNVTKKKKSGDKFRLLRPIILICNDLYHPSLRPLRTSSIAEIAHVRRVPFDQVVQRMKSIYEREGIQCDADGVRKLCEMSWGMSNKRETASTRGIGEGDIRSVLVEAELIAHKLRFDGFSSSQRLTKRWLEQHILRSRSSDGLSRGLGRAGTREIVERVFVDGAGFPFDRQDTQGFQDPFSKEQSKTPVGVAELRKRVAITRLREMVDASGEYDRCVTDCFLNYPTQVYQDDTLLSKPNSAYDWLCFHDMVSSKVYSNQDWELNPYLSQATVAFHHLFASSNKSGDTGRMELDQGEDEEEHPFSGPRADFAAFEAGKKNRAILTEFQSSLSAPLARCFRSEPIATELIPNLTRILAPNIKPVVVGGNGQNGMTSVRKESERLLLKSAVGVMQGMGVTFEKTKVEMETGGYGGWVYRMEPPLDLLTSFSKVKGTILASSSSSAPVRYAVRQALDQEYRKDLLKRQSEAREARLGGSIKPSQNKGDGSQQNTIESRIGRLNGPKRDFFGRVIENSETRPDTSDAGKNGQSTGRDAEGTKKGKKAWVSYHEGFSNAVRKRISMAELLSEL